ncbi:hypothetical protein [Mucilaginibacter sp. UR6-11]|uniref:hypothetical protein n=1 Tax=Mucilaginibacter sp. UR6-11 TaxID=1435644 RepID=UPI001E4DF7A6|nr:hypothetical protein [Mucilaginibacter sp. UR6-11]MCC8425910.1 hypothetical protein [Mucilaginibacter sp. UR6-11]
MATVTFDVPNDLIKKLEGGKLAVSQLLADVLGADDNLEIICAGLVAFHDGDGGSPEVETFTILPGEVTYHPGAHTGKVVLRYRVRFFFGCSDISSDEPANEKSDFEIDAVNNKLLLHIHDPIRRDTIDEF